MNAKLIITMVLIGLVVTFIVQNAAVVEIKFLFWSLEMSRSLLIFIVLCIGVIAGWLLSSFLKHKKLAE
ncbi:MAG: LapA family protein [Desulfobacterales bacterium]|nr:LapA family protein [Desulfobacterales bacterium]